MCDQPEDVKSTTMKKISALLLCVLSAALFSACSTQQLYQTTQAWQRNQCYKLEDMQERNRCLSNADDAFDDYKKQSEAEAH